MKRGLMFSVLVGLAVFGTLMANMLTSMIPPISIGIFTGLTAGTFVFPLLYVVSDVLSKCYGYKASRQVAWVSMSANILMIIIIEAMYYFFPGAAGPLAPLHMSALIITIAGLVSGQVGDWVNDVVFHLLPKKHFYIQALGSSVAGQTVDSAIMVFFGLTIVYHLPLAAALNSFVALIVFKIVVETVLFPLTKFLAKKVDPKEFEAGKIGGFFG